jgi:glycosyltransferase involved in cell wall biosynthesis
VLRYALASAARQSYRRLEILVIGDACTDDSQAVVEALGDRRVRWINLSENSGSQAGPNQAGLEMAGGVLVAYLGHDDLWRRDHVALLVARHQATGAELVSGRCEWVWPGGFGARRLYSGPSGWPPPSALMHTADVGRRAGGWRDHRLTVLPQDNDFVERVVGAGARHSRVEALTVVKFASGVRPGSYVDRRSDEQERWTKRLDRRSFVARELATAGLLLPLRPWSPHPRFAPGAADRPGGIVAELRRIRGLD